MSNEYWLEFKERIYGSDYMIWHDGVADCHYELSREDPTHVRTMLNEGLDAQDYVAVEALKQVDYPEWLPDLRKRLQKTKGKFQIELATYLQQKDPEATDDRYAKIVLHEFDYPTWIMRMDSAILLREFPAQYVTETLLRHVAEDADYFVRYHSAQSYLSVLHLEPADIFEHKEIFALIVDSEDKTHYKEAAEKLRVLASLG